MAQPASKQIETPPRLQGEDVFPVPLSDLKPNSVLGFDLYLERVQSGKKLYLLYRQQDRAFTEKISSKLMSNGIEMLYAPNESKALYEAHCGVSTTPDLQDGEQKESIEPRKLQRLYQDIVPVLNPIYRHGPIQDSVEEVQQLLNQQPDFRVNSSNARNYVQALQKKDQGLHRHSAHVAVLGMALAKMVGVKNREILQAVVLGGFLHDIGLLRIPQAIRLKEDLLSDAELSLIQQHPVYGREIVENIPGLNWQVRKIVDQHHEKCDGTGYPNGLDRDKILLPSRIVAVVEIYDALTTPRPYGKLCTPRKALELMLQTMRNELDMNLLPGLIQLVGTLRASAE